MKAKLLCLLLLTFSLRAGWESGVATVDITPSEPIWLAGYAARTKPMESVRRPIHAKALALKDGTGATNVIVTLDLVGIRREMAESIAARALSELNIPRERIFFNASHTHSAPVVGGPGSYSEIMGPQLAAQKDVIARYTQRLPGLIFDAVAKSVTAMQPASLEFNQGFAGFAVNRRRASNRAFPGPVDHDVPVLAVRNAAGGFIAILFGYACHNTVMGDNTVHGDYAGYAQSYLEQRFPGATALFVMGAGADSNPLPRRKPEHLDRYGATLADAVDEVVRGKMKPVEGPLRAALDFPELAFEGPFDRPRWEKEAASKTGQTASHGRRMLAALEGGDGVPKTRPYAVQAWQFGESLTLIALAGELTVDYALRFKRQFGPNTTWIAGYSNDVFGYIPSLRVWNEGGYEGGDAFLFSAFPGRLTSDTEERISAAVERVVAKVRKP